MPSASRTPNATSSSGESATRDSATVAHTSSLVHTIWLPASPRLDRLPDRTERLSHGIGAVGAVESPRLVQGAPQANWTEEVGERLEVGGN